MIYSMKESASTDRETGESGATTWNRHLGTSRRGNVVAIRDAPTTRIMLLVQNFWLNTWRVESIV